MKAPTTYAEWVDCLDAFLDISQQEAALEAMEHGTIEWTKGVGDRLTQRLFETVDARVKEIGKLMSNELSRISQDTLLIQALMNARRRYSLLHRLVNVPAFPEQVRVQMSEALKSFVNSTQQSLEDSAKHDTTGHLRMLIKNNSLLSYDKADMMNTGPIHAANAAPQAREEGLTPRRRIILR